MGVGATGCDFANDVVETIQDALPGIFSSRTGENLFLCPCLLSKNLEHVQERLFTLATVVHWNQGQQ